jgi:phosphoglycolate phosphatase
MNIVFDLDGTLINSKFRLYKLFQDLTPKSNLNFDEYWKLKKNKISNENILKLYFGYNQIDVDRFCSDWMNLIESPSYLSLDRGFAGVQQALEKLHGHLNLYVCTARQLRQPVLDQLSSLNLLDFFEHVMVTEQRQSKEFLIMNGVPELCANDWIVGDTGKDIEVGKILNMKTCGVLSGFLSSAVLQKYQPDLMINSVADFPSAVI